MMQVVLQSILQTSRRLRKSLHLSPPSAETRPKRKDRTGFILLLLSITLVLAFFALA
jgi:hypothetical protein